MLAEQPHQEDGTPCCSGSLPIQRLLESRDQEVVALFQQLQSSLSSTEKQKQSGRGPGSGGDLLVLRLLDAHIQHHPDATTTPDPREPPRQLKEAKGHYQVLQDDFLFNLRLLEERDKELAVAEVALEQGKRCIAELQEEGTRTKATITHLTTLLQDGRIEQQAELASLQQQHQSHIQDLERAAHDKHKQQQDQLAEAALCIQQLRHDQVLLQASHKSQLAEAHRAHEADTSAAQARRQQEVLEHAHQLQMHQQNIQDLQQAKEDLERAQHSAEEALAESRQATATLQRDLDLSQQRALTLEVRLAQKIAHTEAEQVSSDEAWAMKLAQLEKENAILHRRCVEGERASRTRIADLDGQVQGLTTSLGARDAQLREQAARMQELEGTLLEQQATLQRKTGESARAAEDANRRGRDLRERIASLEQHMASYQEENRLLSLQEAEHAHAVERQRAAADALARKAELAQEASRSAAAEQAELEGKLQTSLQQVDELTRVITQMRADMEALHAYGHGTGPSLVLPHPNSRGTSPTREGRYSPSPRAPSPRRGDSTTWERVPDRTVLELYRHIERLQKLLLETTKLQGKPDSSGQRKSDASPSARAGEVSMENATQELQRLARERARLLDLNNALACEVRELRLAGLRPLMLHAATQCEGGSGARSSSSKHSPALPAPGRGRPPGTASSLPAPTALRGTSIRNWNVRDDPL